MACQAVKRLQKITLVSLLYPLAKKEIGYELRVTGDIDSPREFLTRKKLLKHWIQLATTLSTVPPILYVTASSPKVYEQLKTIIKNVNDQVIVGVHSCRHKKWTEQPYKEAVCDLENCKSLSNWFRFPYVSVNMQLLKAVAKYFKYDSSIGMRGLYPFKIGGMWEYPVAQPTDTGLRDKPLTESVVVNYLWLIHHYQQQDMFLTLLFHPNWFTVELMEVLLCLKVNVVMNV